MKALPTRILLLTILFVSALAAAQNPHSVPTKFNEATVASLQAMMASGQLTSVQRPEHCTLMTQHVHLLGDR